MLILTQLWANKFIRWTLIIVIVLVVMYLIGRAAGLRKAEKDQVKLPNNGLGIPTGWDPVPLANELFTVMDGVASNGTIQKDRVFNKCLGLTPDQLVAVYNAFNRLFRSKNDGTLTQWLRDEWLAPESRNYLVAKLVSINCL